MSNPSYASAVAELINERLLIERFVKTYLIRAAKAFTAEMGYHVQLKLRKLTFSAP